MAKCIGYHAFISWRWGMEHAECRICDRQRRGKDEGGCENETWQVKVACGSMKCQPTWVDCSYRQSSCISQSVVEAEPACPILEVGHGGHTVFVKHGHIGREACRHHFMRICHDCQ